MVRRCFFAFMLMLMCAVVNSLSAENHNVSLTDVSEVLKTCSPGDTVLNGLLMRMLKTL